jgi:alpha-mannosidase
VKVELTEPTIEHLTPEQARALPLSPAAPHTWGKLWDQRWARLDLSAAQPGDHLFWDDQGEATLHLDGMPWFGLDPEHRHAPLPDTPPREAWMECYCCQTFWGAGGLDGAGSRHVGASLVARDDEAWHAWIDLQCLADLAFHIHEDRANATGANGDTAWHYPTLESTTPLHRQLLVWLASAFDAFETGGLAALRPVLAAAYADLRASAAEARIRGCLMGGSHIDLVYLWPERVGEAKIVHTFATANRLMALYPEFTFSFSQPAGYEAVARRAPALADSVRGHLATGRWEASGALWVESDQLIACGEGLARSFILGQEAFARLRPDGSLSRLLWLPDCFGFPSCLPQLMRLSGVDYFFTTKLSWNAINRFPHTSFVWRGADGSEVTAHAPRSSGYANYVQPGRLHAAANSHSQSAVHREFLHPIGFGDGGGGPTAEHVERARRHAELAGVPPVAWDQAEPFFDRLAAQRARLPVWHGELYLEFHRGTQTTHGAVKAAFRSLERALQLAEAVSLATGRPAADLDQAWRRMVVHQFHDDIPGTSVPEVYAESLADLGQLVARLAADSAAALSVSGGELQAFNPHPLPWSGWLDDASGAPRWFELPPLASAPPAPAAAAPAPARATATTLDNDRVSVRLSADGAISALVIDGRPLALEGDAARPVLYPDNPANYDAWDIDHHTLALGQPLDTAAEILVEQTAGPRAVVAVRRAVGKKSALLTRYILEAGADHLRLELELDWAEPQTLLKLPFPTAYRGRLARFGAPFGSTLREQHAGASTVEAQWELPASRWAAVSYDGERDGLWIATEAKYGFSCREGELSVSLVRSPVQTGFQGHGRLTPRNLARHKSETPCSDLGRHVIRLAVGRHDLGAPRAAQPAARAETLFTAPLAYDGAACAAPAPAFEGGETLVPVWSRPLGSGRWVLRLHEVGGQGGETTLRIPAGWTATKTDLLDRPLPAPAAWTGADGARLPFRPYEIVSLRLERR